MSIKSNRDNYRLSIAKFSIDWIFIDEFSSIFFDTFVSIYCMVMGYLFASIAS